MSDTRYLIDTSVFIQAFRSYYSFNLCPGFWESLVTLHGQERVFSIDRVLEEICFGDEDELTVWATKKMPKSCFCDSSASETQRWFAQIQVWANGQTQFSEAAKAEFADETDAWVVAYAGAKNMTVVTQEVYSFNIQRKIPIPNVCKASPFQVPCVDVYTMLNRLGVQFGVLQIPSPRPQPRPE